MLQRAFAFIVVFAAFFALLFAFMAAVDALPEPVKTTHTHESADIPAPGAIAASASEAPVRVVARDISMDVTVANPVSTDIEVLDAALLKGAVRYPTSALLGTDGTVLLFGHSSYLPIIHNQAYKAFSGIQDLKSGAIISVYSGTTEYRYAVNGVRLANADEDVVELPSNGKYLTLVTCDTFATKSSRFVVTADFVGAYAL